MKLRLVGLLIALHAAAALLFLRGVGPGFPLDDAWCHLVYARSLVQGEPFAYNPGQPEAGVTAPAWTVLAAIPAAVAEAGGHPGWSPLPTRPDGPMRVLGGICGLLAGLVAMRLAGRQSAWASGCAAVLFAFDPFLLLGRFSGMELPLFALVTLLFVEALLDGRADRAGWFAGIAVLTRPEGWVLVALGLPTCVSSAGRARAFLPRLLACAVPFALWNLWLAGEPWPNTWANKAAFVRDPGEMLTAAAALFGDTGWGWAFPLAVAIGALVMEGQQPGLAWRLLAAGGALLAGVLLSRTLLVAPAFSPPRIPFYWERYALVAWPPLLVVASSGAGSALRSAWSSLFCRPAGAVRYFGKRRTLDIWGNHDGELAALIRRRDALAGAGDAPALAEADRDVLDYLRSQRPAALACFPMLWAAGHSPELRAWLPRLPRERAEALLAQADDYAALFGLGTRAATFRAPYGAVVPDEVQRDFAIFVKP